MLFVHVPLTLVCPGLVQHDAVGEELLGAEGEVEVVAYEGGICTA